MISTTASASFGDYLELTKPRLSLLSVLTALVAYLAARPSHGGWHLTFAIVGTALAAAGVATLNQFMESDTDALMRRTAERPLPSGRVATGSAFVLGWALCLASLAILFAMVNGASAFFALLTMVCYLSLYTPSKRFYGHSTEVGAIAGALPPLIGWAAAEGRISGLGWILFGVLLFWQIPHFMAIAWLYRRDYAAVRFPMLSVRDESGGQVARWSFLNTLFLVVVSLLPYFLGYCSAYYLAGAAVVGLWFLWRAYLFLKPSQREVAARRLFLASLAYLPAQHLLILVDRLFLSR